MLTLNQYLQHGPGFLRRSVAPVEAAELDRGGAAFALRNFHDAARTVPAYRDFLARHRVDPAAITTLAEFQDVPWTDKKNYIDQYPLADLAPDRGVGRSHLFHTSSGTTGETYLWPCDTRELAEGAAMYEMVLESSFHLSRRRTLLVICFGMGTWIAGSFTALSAFLIQQQKHPLSVVTPGFDKGEALKLIRRLGPEYEQIVLAGIPTFIKDLLEEAAQDPALAHLPLRAIFAGEGFSETWRDYVARLLNQGPAELVTASVYGSADASLMAFESPETIRLRRRLQSNPELCRTLFGGVFPPAIFHFVPSWRYFEAAGAELLINAARGIPLVRYNLHDEGQVVSATAVEDFARRIGEPLRDSPLPLVCLFGRGKFGATLYGVNIPAETVRDALLSPEVGGVATGRFQLETCFDERQNQFVQLRVELAAGTRPTGWSARIEKAVVSHLRGVSTEFRRMHQEKGHLPILNVSLHILGEDDHFSVARGVKSS